MILKLILLMSTFLFSQDPCTCENDFNPVCGFDGFTYPNECMALCFGVSVDYQGSCTNQINCLPGEYQNENGDCQVCEPGTFSDGNASQCDACPAGTFAQGQTDCSDIGMPDVFDCGASSCTECPPGYFSSSYSSDCLACEPGAYSEGNASQCDFCPDNLFSNGQIDCNDLGLPDIMECGGTECVDCNGQPWGNATIDEYGECSESQSGCTYIEAENFNPDAFLDDGSCVFPCEGDFNYDGNKDILDVIFLVNEIINGMICE